MLLLDAKALASVLDYAACVEALEAAFRNPANVPARLQLDAGRGLMWVMPAAAGAALGVKLVTQFEGNASRGLDRIQGVYLYLDAETGRLLALLDGRVLTGIRTAAVSALATRYLANPGPATLAVFGTGVQARAHLEAMRTLFEIREALVCGSTREKTRAFAEAHGCRAATVEDCYAATLICACTTSRAPLWDGARLRAGTHVNAVGNARPDSSELDEATVRRARVAVDTREGALAEAGDLRLPLAAGTIAPDHIAAELAEIVRGEKKVRRSAEEITLFKSVGYALSDLALARLAYEQAAARGLGRQVEI